MPGGFTSLGRSGYETVDDVRDVEAQPPPRPTPPVNRDVPSRASPAPHGNVNTTQAGPAGYQTT